MAYTVGDNPKVGQLVYEYGMPQNPGIIREIVSDETLEYPTWKGNYYKKIIIKVEWLKETKTRNKVTLISPRGLNDFESLIEDHRRKHENQTKLAEQLRAMR